MEKNSISKQAKLLDIESYTPPQIASKIDRVATFKGNLSFTKILLLGILAGAYIGLGAQFATLVTSDSTLHAGLTKIIGGIAFSLGLILVIVAGSELFTGNCLIIMGYISGRITRKHVRKSWTVSIFGNLIGSLIMVFWVYHTHQWEFLDNMVGAKALLIAHKKTSLSFMTALARGVLCNAMVCLAVWLCYSGRSVADKILALVFPIAGFVASGFEHCVANMYFIPMGIILKKKPEVVAAAEKMYGKPLDLSLVSWKGFFINNEIPVILGNIVGGVILVGVVYWFIYLRPSINISFNVKQDNFSENK